MNEQVKGAEGREKKSAVYQLKLCNHKYQEQ